MITLKSIPVWATSGGPTHDEPMAVPWGIWVVDSCSCVFIAGAVEIIENREDKEHEKGS